MKPGPIKEWNASVVNSPAHLRDADGADEAYWERHSDSYARNRTSGADHRRVLQWLDRRIRNVSVIEIGPGPGIFTRFLARHCTRVTAVEPSPANAAWLHREMPDCRNLRVECEKWENVAIEPHDIVFSAGTLYVFSDIEAAIAKMLRHARSKILLVTAVEGQDFQREVAAALGLPPPAPSRLSPALFSEVLRGMNLAFTVESFCAAQEYVYPDIGHLVDLWKGSLSIRREHWTGLEYLLMRRGLYGKHGTEVRVPRLSTTYMFEISV